MFNDILLYHVSSQPLQPIPILFLVFYYLQNFSIYSQDKTQILFPPPKKKISEKLLSKLFFPSFSTFTIYFFIFCGFRNFIIIYFLYSCGFELRKLSKKLFFHVKLSSYCCGRWEIGSKIIAKICCFGFPL